jgi:DNA replication protein DnaC
MLHEPTAEKLAELKLHALSRAWQEQAQDASIHDLAFDERLALLVEAEWLDRQNKRLVRSLKEAKLRISAACIEGIEFEAARKLDRKKIRELSSCRWIDDHQNVIVTGKTGVGKSYLACALAQQACRKGYRAIYRRTSRLFDELRLAHADGTYPRLLARLARVDVLVIDDWGLSPLKDGERRDLLEIMEDRYGLKSTIWTSQLPVEAWHDHIGDPTVADAICDRVVHNAHRIVLKGPSRRKNESNVD